MASPWDRLKSLTPARIGLGRAGDGLPTAALLDLQMAHAKAGDAVHGVADWEHLSRARAAADDPAGERGAGQGVLSAPVRSRPAGWGRAKPPDCRQNPAISSL